MKKLLSLCMSLIVTSAFAQDIIVKKDGTTILSKVTEISSFEVKYKKHSNQDGPTYAVQTSEILSINYANGETEDFGKKTGQFYAGEEYILKVGTEIPIQIVSPIKARDVTVGQIVDFKVSNDISVNGTTVIPYGTPVKGTVYLAKRSSWFGTKGKLGIKLQSILLPNGDRIPLSNGNVYVTGINRTPLSLLLFLFVTMPACAITGSRAEIPMGYETMAHIAQEIRFSSAGNIIDNNVLTPAPITAPISFTSATTLQTPSNPITIECFGVICQSSGWTIEANIKSIDNGVITYYKKNSSTIKTINVDKIDNIILFKEDAQIPPLPCNGMITKKNGKKEIVEIKAVKENSIIYKKGSDTVQITFDKIKAISYEDAALTKKYGCPVFVR